MSNVPARRIVLGIVLALIATAVGLAAAPRVSADPVTPRVTVIGDSVQASFQYVPAAVRRLRQGLHVTIDARVCRRLIFTSCPFEGVTPQTALQVIRSSPDLGAVVVVNVGYNDDPSVYNVGAIMRALRTAGVGEVVWVTLREERESYRINNAKIRAAARNWSASMRVADWNAVSTGRPWFGSDGLHLNTAGTMALSGLIRREVLAALRSRESHVQRSS